MDLDLQWTRRVNGDGFHSSNQKFAYYGRNYVIDHQCLAEKSSGEGEQEITVEKE